MLSKSSPYLRTLLTQNGQPVANLWPVGCQINGVPLTVSWFLSLIFVFDFILKDEQLPAVHIFCVWYSENKIEPQCIHSKMIFSYEYSIHFLTNSGRY